MLNQSSLDKKKKKKTKSEKLEFTDPSLIVISEPTKIKHVVQVKFNNQLNQYEGLPKQWRELLEMEPQAKEVLKLDSNMSIKDKRRVRQMQFHLKAKDNLKGSYTLTVTSPKKKRLSPAA